MKNSLLVERHSKFSSFTLEFAGTCAKDYSDFWDIINK